MGGNLPPDGASEEHNPSGSPSNDHKPETPANPPPGPKGSEERDWYVDRIPHVRNRWNGRFESPRDRGLFGAA